MRKLKDSGFRMVEVPVHHFAALYGTSQFFKPKRIARAIRGVGDLVRAPRRPARSRSDTRGSLRVSRAAPATNQIELTLGSS